MEKEKKKSPTRAEERKLRQAWRSVDPWTPGMDPREWETRSILEVQEKVFGTNPALRRKINQMLWTMRHTKNWPFELKHFCLVWKKAALPIV